MRLEDTPKALAKHRLNYWKMSCCCAGSQEVWEDGQAFRDTAAQIQAIAQQRETIEAARKVGRLQSVYL